MFLCGINRFDFRACNGSARYPSGKIIIDNKTCIGYLDIYLFEPIDASICWDADDTDTQFAILLDTH